MSNTKMISSRVHVDFLEDVRSFLSQYYSKDRNVWDQDGSGLMSDYYVMQYAAKFISLEIDENYSAENTENTDVCTVTEAMKITRYSRENIIKLIKKEKIVAAQPAGPGGIYLISRESLDKLLKPKVDRD